MGKESKMNPWRCPLWHEQEAVGHGGTNLLGLRNILLPFYHKTILARNV